MHERTPDPTLDSSVHRIQALLDKAESTSFPDEADALLAKAQELMARHAIDAAMLAQSAQRDEDPIDERIVIVAPYASAKATLLGAVATANRCRVVVGQGASGTRHCTVVGFAEDLANTRTLFSSLSYQAVRFMLDAPVPAGDTPRRFRHAFLLAYAFRIGERLREAGRAAQDQAQADQFDRPGGPSVSLVLTTRAAKVDHEFDRLFPYRRRASVSVSSAAGARSGRRAADRAALGQRNLSRAPRSLGSG
jgi:hypothetical protein